MSIEEKAKAYDEALERARKYMAKGYDVLMPEIFPELRESEDERIRKALIDFFDSALGKDLLQRKCGQNPDTVLAYLEKQKYNRMKPIYDARESFESALEKAWNDYHNGYENVDKLEDDYVECAHAKGFREGYLFGIEKQKEQKPADYCSVRDEFDLDGNLKQKPTATINGKPIPTENHSVNIPLAEWSNEDEAHRNFILESLEDQIRFCKKDAEGAYYAKQIRTAQNWLKLLDSQLKLNCKDCAMFLNGECMKPRWKPSEHQMTILKAVKAYVGRGSGYWGEGLGSLIEDLEKL